MILYNFDKMSRHKSIAYSIQVAVVAAHSVAFHHFGMPFVMAVAWTVSAMAGLAFLTGFHQALGSAKASMEIFDEMKAADVPFTVLSGDVP